MCQGFTIVDASEYTIEVAGIDIKPAYCSSHPQFNDRPVAMALGFLCISVLKNPYQSLLGLCRRVSQPS